MSLMTYQEVRPWARSIKQKTSRARNAAVAHRSQHRRIHRRSVALAIGRSRRSARGSTAARRRAAPADAPPPLTFPPTSEWTYGEPDLIVRMEKGFKIPAEGPDFIPEEIVDPKLTEDRYVKWVQIIPDATRAVHHSHVYVDLPEGIDTEGLGLGMGSNVGNSMDLIEYGAGNDADIFPDGTTKILKKGSLFRFESHYHPYGEETLRPPEGRHQVLSERRRAEVRRHVAPHSHRRRQRLGLQPRAHRRSAAARRPQARRSTNRRCRPARSSRRTRCTARRS